MRVSFLYHRTETSSKSYAAVGTLINTNTVEEFRNRSKPDLLRMSAEQLWAAITSGSALEKPSVLASFLMFTFAVSKL